MKKTIWKAIIKESLSFKYDLYINNKCVLSNVYITDIFKYFFFNAGSKHFLCFQSSKNIDALKSKLHTKNDIRKKIYDNKYKLLSTRLKNALFDKNIYLLKNHLYEKFGIGGLIGNNDKENIIPTQIKTEASLIPNPINEEFRVELLRYQDFFLNFNKYHCYNVYSNKQK